MRWIALSAVFVAVALLSGAEPSGGPWRQLPIPPRPAKAMSGSQFARTTWGMKGTDRQRLGVAEILRGNVPESIRDLHPIRLELDLPSGHHSAVVWVTPDYVAIGEDRDALRLPLTWPSATQVATSFGCILPTTRIVDAVWQQADLRLDPQPLPPGPRMRSSEYFLRHRAMIEGQRHGRAPQLMVAGHKKDIVLTNLLTRRPDRIAIYGWHQRNGEPIQPLSTIHGARYADYSHGVRLVADDILLDGRPTSIYDVLAHPELSALLSDEGPIVNAWQLMHPDTGKSRKTAR